jgi:hypothetical protein
MERRYLNFTDWKKRLKAMGKNLLIQFNKSETLFYQFCIEIQPPTICQKTFTILQTAEAMPTMVGCKVSTPLVSPITTTLSACISVF